MSKNRSPSEQQSVISCGILKKELEFLARKNNWTLDSHFLPPAAHLRPESFSKHLEEKIDECRPSSPLLVFGTCLLGMDELAERNKLTRTSVHNCLEMLLSPEVYLRELENGAYFLVEEWARHWPAILRATFGPDLNVAKEILRVDRKYILAIRTPASGDYRAAAEIAGELADLPVVWKDIGLEYFESILRDILSRRTKAA